MSNPSRIQQRRNLVGTSREMYGHAAEILEGPQSKRFKAVNATNPQYITDIQKRSGLCKQLDNDYYKQELYEIAMELGLAVNKQTSKRELCERISVYAKEAGDIPMPRKGGDDEETLNRANEMLQKSLRPLELIKEEMRELFNSREWSLEEFEAFIRAEPELFKLYKQDIVVGSAEYGNIEVLEYFLKHYKQYLESDADLHERLKTTATSNSTLQVIMEIDAMRDWWDTLD